MAPKDTNNNGDTFVGKRMEQLQLFLDCVAEHPVLKASKAFEDFLKIAGDDQFTQAKTNHDNKITMSSVSALKCFL